MISSSSSGGGSDDAPSLASATYSGGNRNSGVGQSSSSSSVAPTTSSLNAGSSANATLSSTAAAASASATSLDSQIERLKRCEYLRENEVKALCLRAREILVDEGNVQRVDAPVTVRKSVCDAIASVCVIIFNCIVISLPISDLRRHSWSILRPSRTLQSGR